MQWHQCTFVCECVCASVYNHLPACGDSAAYDLSNSLHLVCLVRTHNEHLEVCEDPESSHKRVIII